MSHGPRVAESWSPDLPHPDPRRELFARALANGSGASAAYRAHMAKAGTTAASIKAAAWTVAKESPGVKERVEWLRRRLADKLEVDDVPLTATEIRGLMESVTTALTECHQIGQLSGVASPSELSKLDKAIVTHIGRLHRSTTPDAKPKTAAEFQWNLDAVPECTCDD